MRRATIARARTIAPTVRIAERRKTPSVLSGRRRRPTSSARSERNRITTSSAASLHSAGTTARTTTVPQNHAYRNDGRRNESFQGRVSRVEHYNGGYRVWIGGTRYPFFIPYARWSRFPLRVGINVNLGGYWNPAGYYNVYDVGPYATSGDMHGVVESVDYRRGTAVLRDDISGSFVTVVLRGNDPRLGDLRPGDYVDLTGAWNRSGVFDAYNVADLRGGGNGYDRRNGY